MKKWNETWEDVEKCMNCKDDIDEKNSLCLGCELSL